MLPLHIDPPEDVSPQQIIQLVGVWADKDQVPILTEGPSTSQVVAILIRN